VKAANILIAGAGVGGLAAAIDLARRGFAVTVVEKDACPGGKLRQSAIGTTWIDSGPTVLTMRWVFEELFADAGADFQQRLTTRRLEILARHAWPDGTRLDLHADLEASVEAIHAFAGAREANGFRALSTRARRIYETLEQPFIRSAPSSPVDLVRAAGIGSLANLWRISPFSTLWSALGEHFRDPRLRQLFARYATYCGSSPFAAPATLLLIAHVERAGVWAVAGGMQGLAAALARLAADLGAHCRYGDDVAEVLAPQGSVCGVTLGSGETLQAEAVLINADAQAVRQGHFGKAARDALVDDAFERSLSAVTWAMVATATGFPLSHHTIFFSGDYKAEFDALFAHGRLPEEPTVYVCAQDRSGAGIEKPHGAERLFCLVNAPALADRGQPETAEIERCETSAFRLLEQCGLTIERSAERTERTTPMDFARRFPGTGGALYGQATHGWTSSFRRPGARTRLPGLYLAGGSAHPGAGLPMAALSGRLAAAAIARDFASTRRYGKGVTLGGMSTP